MVVSHPGLQSLVVRDCMACLLGGVLHSNVKRTEPHVGNIILSCTRNQTFFLPAQCKTLDCS